MNNPIDYARLQEQGLWPFNWEPWFAWYPVRLLTGEIAWLRWVQRRDPKGHRSQWSAWDGYDYAN